MSPLDFTHILTQAIDELSESESYKGLFHRHKDGESLPSAKVLYGITELSHAVPSPRYYGSSIIDDRTINYHIGINIEKLFDLLTEQILVGLCFSMAERDYSVCSESRREEAARLVASFTNELPAMKRILATDVEAAYDGNPATKNYGEVIFRYPAIRAIGNYRIVYELLELSAPLVLHTITEIAHGEAGIGTHPRAKIGSHFTIDHGTGVVTGATSIAGSNVRLCQNVALGAKSFPLDADGKPIKDIPRHPILKDNVIIYSSATTLGGITIKGNATVEGDTQVAENVPAGTKIVQTKAKK